VCAGNKKKCESNFKILYDFLTIISVFAYMCLYLHTDMYVELINTRWHERICPYQIFEKADYGKWIAPKHAMK